MNTLFDRIEIKNIQFENNAKEVRVNCNVCQGLNCTESTLLIDFTDLNRILAKLSVMGVELDFSAFEVTQVNNNDKHYELDAEHVFEMPLTIENFEMIHPYRQLCA